MLGGDMRLKAAAWHPSGLPQARPQPWAGPENTVLLEGFETA
jgi:hypothetical protein